MTTVESVKVIINGEDNVSKVFNKVDGKANKTFSSIGKYAVAGFAVVGTAAVFGLGKAISSASDFEEINSRFGVVFRDIGKEAEDMAKTLQKSYNFSIKDSKEMLSSTGDILTGIGFAGDEALRFSGSVATMAADIGSFTNASKDMVGSAITKALLGERESLKTYGIAIQEADVQQELLKMGMQDLEGEALKQAKAQATLNLIYQQSPNAIGDVERTMDSFANQSVAAKNAISDLGIELGNVFLPFATTAITTVADFVSGLRGFSEEGSAFKEILTIIGTKGQLAFEMIGVAFNTVKGIFVENSESIKEILGGVADFVTDLGTSILETFTAIADVVGEALTTVFDVFMNNKDSITETFESIKEVAISMFGGIADFFTENKDLIVGIFKSLAETAVSTFNLIGGVVKIFKSMWDNNFLGIADTIKTGASFLKFFGVVAMETFGGIVDVLSYLANNFKYIWENIKLSTFNAINGMIDMIQNFVNSIVDAVNTILPKWAELGRVDISDKKIDTEMTQARVTALEPKETLGEMMEQRGVRLEEAGVRLFDDLKAIEKAKEDREEAATTRDAEMLEAFRASKAETGGTEIIINAEMKDDATIDALVTRIEDINRDKLASFGVDVL